MTKKLLWVGEVARELGVCARTVSRWAGAGLVDVIRFEGSANPTSAKVLSLAEGLNAIQAGRTTDYDRTKRRLDAVTFGGTFSPNRAKVNLKLHTGIVHGDLDHLTDLDAAKHALTTDPHVLYCFISPSGMGLKVGVAPVGEDDAYKHACRRCHH
jgi:hypothetical protein